MGDKIMAAKALIRDNAFFLAIYIVQYFLMYLLGDGVVINYKFLQFMSTELLRDRLWETIYNLHSQPPLMNLILGLLLKLESATGITPEAVILPVNFILGVIVILCLSFLAKELIKNKTVSFIALLLILINPYFYSKAQAYFYTFYELVILSLLAVCIYKFLKKPNLKTYIHICLLFIGMVYTRSLFHFIYPLPVLIGLPLIAKIKKESVRADYPKYAACIGITVVVFLAWPMKNYLRFNYFGYSSWQGYNLSRGLPNEMLIRPLFLRVPGTVPAAILDPEVQRAQESVPMQLRGIPVLTELQKPNGRPNWNHYYIIIVSREMGETALNYMRQDPVLIIKKALRFYFKSYSMFEARKLWPPENGRMDASTTPVIYWLRGYEILLYQCFAGISGTPFPEWSPLLFLTSFTLLFPVLVIYSAREIKRGWKPRNEEAATAAFMLYSIIWVLLMVLFVDGIEGNRYKYSTEPFMLILAGWVIARFVVGKKNAARAEAGG